MIHMIRQDLIELYQLLKLYRQVYPEDQNEAIEMLIEEVSEKYEKLTGTGITTARNPRGAGRKSKAGMVSEETVYQLSDQGMSIRRIATETGCSFSHIQKLLKRR